MTYLGLLRSTTDTRVTNNADGKTGCETTDTDGKTGAKVDETTRGWSVEYRDGDGGVVSASCDGWCCVLRRAAIFDCQSATGKFRETGIHPRHSACLLDSTPLT
jgi:hypothetical protein